jgi:predicted MFS family arabinose efflux permease
MPVRIYILALGTFAIGTDGFVMAGVLGDISVRTHVSISTAGLLVTMFAWTYAVASPVVGALGARIPRRRMLCLALIVFGIGNILAALATSYALLAVARVVTAIGAASYTPSASVTAAALAPERLRGRALGIVMGGLTIATVFGVPIGTYLGTRTSYHGVFWFVTALGVLALVGVAVLMPDVPLPPKAALTIRGSLKIPGVRSTLLVNVFAAAGGFTAYTYISPLLHTVAGVSGTTISLLLMAYGFGGAVGSTLGGWLSDRWGAYQAALLGLATYIVFLATLTVTAVTVAGAAVAVFGWGVTSWLLVPPQQHRLIGIEPKAASRLLSLSASTMYIGIGSAATVGAAVVRFSGVRSIPLAAASFGLIALLIFIGTATRPSAVSGGATAAPESAPEPAKN